MSPERRACGRPRARRSWPWGGRYRRGPALRHFTGNYGHEQKVRAGRDGLHFVIRRRAECQRALTSSRGVRMVEDARYSAQSRRRREKHTLAKRSTVLLIACCLTSHCNNTCEGFRAPVLQVCAARGSRASVCALATDRILAAPPAARRTVATAALLRASRQPCAPLRLPRAARRPRAGGRAMGPGCGRRGTA